MVHPLEENVWDFLYIDEFGNLTPKWRPDLDGFDPRAVGTRDLLRLDRQALQEARRHRRREVVRMVEDGLAGYHSGWLTRTDLSARRRDLLEAAAQPDVADYFLNGPGRAEEPFAAFLRVVSGL